MANYNKVPVIISIIALFFALSGLPYGYYQLLRFLICGVGIYAAYMAYTFNRVGWAWTMGVIALIFNPFIKFYFGREFWQILDVVAAIIFIVSLFLIKRPNREFRGRSRKCQPIKLE